MIHRDFLFVFLAAALAAAIQVYAQPAFEQLRRALRRMCVTRMAPQSLAQRSKAAPLHRCTAAPSVRASSAASAR